MLLCFSYAGNFESLFDFRYINNHICFEYYYICKYANIYIVINIT